MVNRLVVNRLEALAPLLLLIHHGLIYNEVGQLAKLRGVDFGPAIETPLDGRLPFVPLAILPYMTFWVLPVMAFGYLYWKRGFDPDPYRRIFAALLVLTLCCMALWILFPVHVGLRFDEARLAEHGILGKFIFLTYAAATPWNACPSFHVAGSWILYRILRLYVSPLPRIFLALMILITVSTVLIKIHYVLDVVFGLLIGELAFRLVLKRLEDRQAFARVSPRRPRGGSRGLAIY